MILRRRLFVGILRRSTMAIFRRTTAWAWRRDSGGQRRRHRRSRTLPTMPASFITTMARETSMTPRASRVGTETLSIFWGAGMVNLDNHGQPDLWMDVGNVYPGGPRRLAQDAIRRRARCFAIWAITPARKWQRKAPALLEAHSSRGCAFGDLDNHGDVDMLILNLNENPSLLRKTIFTENKPASRWNSREWSPSEARLALGFLPITAGKRRQERFESIPFLFLQRFPPALRPRKPCRGRCGRAL